MIKKGLVLMLILLSFIGVLPQTAYADAETDATITFEPGEDKPEPGNPNDKDEDIQGLGFHGTERTVQLGTKFTLYPKNDSWKDGTGWNVDEVYFNVSYNNPPVFEAISIGSTSITFTDHTGNTEEAKIHIVDKNDSNGKFDNSSLPSTGQSIVNISIVIGVGLVGLGLTALYLRRKKGEANNEK